MFVWLRAEQVVVGKQLTVEKEDMVAHIGLSGVLSGTLLRTLAAGEVAVG
jgi:ABC-type nitrate/sulfonate/bicarbonate transport system ATPase subunit